MNGHYAYTPAIWPSVFTAFLLIALAAYSWRRRSVPGTLPFAISCLFAVFLAAAEFMTYLAVDPETQLYWNKFADIWWLPGATATTCFILEYAWPGRWLSRRNLVLLSIVPLLGILYVLTGDFFHLIPPGFKIGGLVGESFGQFGGFLFIYSLVLALINFIVFVWLFIRSPQHRWPVFLMATGQIITRILLVRSSPELDARLFYVPEFLFAYLAYAIALFGFRIFDPVPMARRMAIEQSHAGMLVLDLQGRVASLNPFAERILAASAKEIKGRPVRELLPAYPDGQFDDTGTASVEFCLPQEHRDGVGEGSTTRDYTLTISLLKDWRGLEIGRLLLLQDVTEPKRARELQKQQQLLLATLHERERLARELHDSIGQVMGYAGFQLDAASKLIREGRGDDAISQLSRLSGVFRDSHADVREHILNLRTGFSPQQPLFLTLQQYLEGFNSNYDIRMLLNVDERLDDAIIPPDHQMQVFRIVQEALSNARKHGRAHLVQVTITGNDHTIHMTIQDDGVGFDPSASAAPGKNHFGVQFMRERAEAMGGCLQVESSPGAGTRVVLDIPGREL